MRYPRKDIPSAEEIECTARGILQESLKLTDRGRKCMAQSVLLILFFAVSRASSIHDACLRLRHAPCGQAIRNALAAWMPSMPKMESRLNQALRFKLPKGLKNRPLALAIDLTEICYYGRPWRRKNELRRGKRRNGTSRFHAYATLCVIEHGQRATLAMTYVWKKDTMAPVVRRLLEDIRGQGLKIRYLLLDRGFYSVAVVECLKEFNCPFLMPVVHRGRKSKRPLKDLKGTRRFLSWKRSGWDTHTMSNATSQAPVNICVAYQAKAKAKPRRMVFAYWGFKPGSPAWVWETYRSRYGIEASYRQMNQGRIRTCSRDPRLRLMLVGIALVLRNLWVWLHANVLGRFRRGRVEIDPEFLRLRSMLLMLQRCAEAVLECAEIAQLSEPPPLADLLST
jgi:hypothetical protein